MGKLNPIYERELNKPDVHQRKGMWKVSMCWERGKGCRHTEQQGVEPSVELTVGDEGVREVSAEGDSDSVGDANGGLMLPVVLVKA